MAKRKRTTARKKPAKTSSARKTERKKKTADKQDLTEQIREQAYHLYEKRGHEHGDDQSDWYEAEKLLKSQKKK